MVIYWFQADLWNSSYLSHGIFCIFFCLQATCLVEYFEELVIYSMSLSWVNSTLLIMCDFSIHVDAISNQNAKFTNV